MPDRRYLFGTRDGHVVVWSAINGEVIVEAPGSSGAIDHKTDIALVGSEIWDLNRRRRINSVGTGNGSMRAISPDGRLAVMELERELQIWSLQHQSVIARVQAAPASFLAISKDGKQIAIGRGSQFEVYDLKSGRRLRTNALAGVWPFRLKPTKGFTDVVEKKSIDFTVIYEKTNDFGIEDPSKPLYQIDWESRPASLFSKAKSMNGLTSRKLGNDVVLVLAADPSAEHATLVGHKAPVTQIAYSPDRWTMATGDSLGEVRIWDTFSGQQLSQFNFPDSSIASLDFSPDAQFLMAATKSEIRVYPIVPSP